MKLLINMAVCAVLMTSCTKVIDVNLNSVAKKYVIEGYVDNFGGPAQVSITQTKDFDENNDFPGVSGAEVTISDNGADAIQLTESNAGFYETGKLQGIVGHTYTLTVKIDGETFTASSTMPQQVTFDSIFVENREVFDGTKPVVNVVYQDPVGKGNGYHFIEYRNNKRTKTIFASSDDFTDGNKITRPLLTFDEEDDEQLKSGDVVNVVMECIDRPVYKYWYSLDAAAGSGNSATPANPVSNISGGALGYFSAHTSEVKTITVP